MSIAAQMREASAQDHKNAESMRFIKELMEGTLSGKEYSNYLNQLAFVYQALEAKLQDLDAMPFAFSLLRFESIKRDLLALGLEQWESASKLPATENYVARISELGDHTDVRLVAHHYTRYLGDLSGGQAIGALVRRHYGLTEEQTTFYRFEQIENIVRFKEEYRAALDGQNLSDSELEQLLTEVQLAFQLNQGLFAELSELVAVS